MSKRTREINARYDAARKRSHEMEQQERAAKRLAQETAAKADRLTRDALRPQVSVNRHYR